MEKVKHHLFRDLTASLSSQAKRNINLVIIALSSALAVISIPSTETWGLGGVAMALIGALVALRIDGTKNAVSFKLYRTESGKIYL